MNLYNRFMSDVKSGEVQRKIDSGWQQQDILVYYSVSHYAFRREVDAGNIDFVHNTRTYRKKDEQLPFEATLSPMRRLALCEVWK